MVKPTPKVLHSKGVGGWVDLAYEFICKGATSMDGHRVDGLFIHMMGEIRWDGHKLVGILIHMHGCHKL